MTDTQLETEVQFVKGVGPARAKAFAKVGVSTLSDLLEYYPRDWNFCPEPIKIKDILPEHTITAAGVIEQTEFRKYSRNPAFNVTIADETGLCNIVWFHGKWLAEQLTPGKLIMVTGKAALYKHQLQLTNPKFVVLEDNDNQPGSDFLSGPVYPASGKLTSQQIKRIITPLIDDMDALATEFYDNAFLKKAELIGRAQAFKWIHSPPDEDKLSLAKRRLKYDELFLMQLGLALKRYKTRHFSPAVPMKLTEKIDSRIRKRFPFLLTADQDNVISEIAADMAKSEPMNRLLQGDVGSGKTVVALYAALLAIANKTQVAIMAPTEILANQHFLSIERFLKNSNVKRAIITGGLTGKKRTELTDKIASGRFDIIVGTVALLQGDIEFANLGLTIIDEQHKFGVHQRATLRKERSPHCLVMTATPIPRTLAMSAFGDLDVSTIKHCPPGRGTITTKWVQPEKRDAAYQFIRKRLNAKKQAYFVYPRIDSQAENDDIKAATDEYKILSERIFPEFTVALLHGRMKSDQKQEIMERFRKKKIDLLVSTVVIEVGLDVPGATIMVIEGADHFGLAQLHQLRGRIGRGQSNSYCFLFAETQADVAKNRLQIMTRTNDGFEIAEEDLRIRGPGELFSTRQHGLPDLKIANIIDDFKLLMFARKNAFDLVTADPMLTSRGHRNLRKTLIDKFGEKLGLADIA